MLGVHGVLAEERGRAQPFVVDIDLEADLTAAGASDRLEDTVDYGALAQAVAKVVEGESYALLERLAERIAEVALAEAGVERVTVAVQKARPPVPVDLSTAGVRITRPRRSS